VVTLKRALDEIRMGEALLQDMVPSDVARVRVACGLCA
jgi:hypothetical protein